MRFDKTLELFLWLCNLNMLVYKGNTQWAFVSEWHNCRWDLDKPLSRFGINPAVPLCDPSTGQAHQRLKVNTRANQLSSQKHSASTSHCAITAHTLMYVCMHAPTHAVDPHPSCTGGHDLMYRYWESNEAEDAWPLTAAADQLKSCVLCLKAGDDVTVALIKYLKARLVLLRWRWSWNWQHVDGYMYRGIWFYVWM